MVYASSYPHVSPRRQTSASGVQLFASSMLLPPPPSPPPPCPSCPLPRCNVWRLARRYSSAKILCLLRLHLRFQMQMQMQIPGHGCNSSQQFRPGFRAACAWQSAHEVALSACDATVNASASVACSICTPCRMRLGRPCLQSRELALNGFETKLGRGGLHFTFRRNAEKQPSFVVGAVQTRRRTRRRAAQALMIAVRQLSRGGYRRCRQVKTNCRTTVHAHGQVGELVYCAGHECSEHPRQNATGTTTTTTALPSASAES
jgi:hypothetical protein